MELRRAERTRVVLPKTEKAAAIANQFRFQLIKHCVFLKQGYVC